MHELFETHRPLLGAALDGLRRSGFADVFAEWPTASDYGAEAAAQGRDAFHARLGRSFKLAGDDAAGRLGAEQSPYGFQLEITYPARTPAARLDAAERVAGTWARAPVESRLGVAMEALARLNAQSFEMAHAVMHTTGQPWLMAFQSGGPHAQNRALSALAQAYEAMRAVPARHVMPRVEADAPGIERAWRVVPQGTALVLGSALWPNWCAYPGLFASLATGNPVLVKPHPQAILPLALTVATLRQVLREAGWPADVVQLCVDTKESPLARTLATAPAVRIVDYAGGPGFVRWLRTNAPQARLNAETRGLNPAVVDSTDDFDGMCRHLAYALSLHSGQTRTTPQNIFVPADGIATEAGRRTFDEVAAGIAHAIDDLVVAESAATVLGAIADEATLQAVRRCQALGRILRDGARVDLPGHPKARTLTPLLLAADAGRDDVYEVVRPGPVALIVKTFDTAESIERAAHGASRQGAVLAVVYSTNDHVLEAAADALVGAGVALVCNPTGQPNGEAGGHERPGDALDPDFASSRFRVVEVRHPRPPPAV